ncbi:MAG TPA: glycoside hydrolase family 11 protein, partial [Polyangiaceae bacterium]|nr:glycoside hydrolase family 11 protein [Polyangiaceae bacterium]
WTIWSNMPSKPGSITTYDTPAFTGTWNDSGDFLARIGLQWNGTKTHQELGTIAAQFSVKKNGTAGDYSFIGIYGWSLSPCVEFYIVDQSYKPMPFNPGMTTKMGPDTMIDGGLYIFYKRTTNGTGGSKCGSQATWDQYYSIRKTGRDCGHISVSEHFKAWEANGLPLGKIDQAQILLEVGGGVGSADFNVANVTLTPP